MNKQELEYAEYLIGKRKYEDLSAENQARVDQKRAVREAQNIVGEYPAKPFPGGIVLDYEEEDE